MWQLCGKITLCPWPVPHPPFPTSAGRNDTVQRARAVSCSHQRGCQLVTVTRAAPAGFPKDLTMAFVQSNSERKEAKFYRGGRRKPASPRDSGTMWHELLTQNGSEESLLAWLEIRKMFLEYWSLYVNSFVRHLWHYQLSKWVTGFNTDNYWLWCFIFAFAFDKVSVL